MPVDLHHCFRVDPAELPGEAIIFGSTAAMREVHGKIERVLHCDLPVLLQGERGTGKDLVARFLHARSGRRDGPFVKLSCAAMPQRLLETELLGCEAGSALGTNEARPGLIEVAEGGTLFLDEIGEIGLALQRKLLFLLQDGRYFRVGSREERQARVRIICSTNVHLGSAVKKGTFRRDLFNHMEGMCFRLSALRERKEDIPLLWEFFSEKLARKLGKSAPRLTPAVQRVLVEWDWPGNLCELENCIARVMVLGDEEGIGEQLKRQAAFVNGVNGQEKKRRRTGGSSRSLSDGIKSQQVPETDRRSQRKTPDDLKRSHRSLLYRLRNGGRLQRPRRRRRFPRPE